MARLINAEVMGFFATPQNVTAMLAEWLQAPAGDKMWRLLDPCCGEGVAAADLARVLGGNVQTWGAELSPKRAERAAQVLNKVHNTAWQATRVNKESVSVLWLNPPYDSDLDGRDKRLEIEFLRTSLNTLVIGGVLIYIIPQHVLGYRDTARLLVGHFDTITALRFPDGEYERFRQVVVLARRKPYATPTNEAVDEIRALRDTDLPALSAPMAPWPLAVPAAPSKAAFAHLNRSDKEQAALAYAQPWPEELLQALQPQETQQPLCPPLPPKKGHVAMLMAAGLMGTLNLTKNGQRLLVKGRVRKKQDVTEEMQEDGDVVVVRKDRFVTTVGVTSPDGVRVMDDVNALTEFMEDYGEELAGEILKHHPRYDLRPTAAEWQHVGTLGRNRRPLPGQKEAGLLPVQKHLAIGLARTLRAKRNALLQGEMGVGKTTVGLATIDALDAYPAIVMGPPHLVEKWLREAAEVIPGVQVRELAKVGRNGGPGDVNDARQFVDDWRAGRLGTKAIAVISETSAKLGSGWGGAPATRYTLPRYRSEEERQDSTERQRFRKAAAEYRQARERLLELREGDDTAALARQREKVAQLRKQALGSAVAYPVCPDCGRIQSDRDGYIMSFKVFDKSPKHCTQSTQGWARDEQGRKILNDDQQPVWVWDTRQENAPRCSSAIFAFGDKFRRWPIADYIRRQAGGVFQMLVADEVHQFRGKDSDRGRAFHHLIGATKYHLGMTGTVYGGKSTSVFYLFYRLFPQVRQEFAHNDEKKWAGRYGVLETRQYGKGSDEEAAAYGSFNATRRGKVMVTELPGVSPAILGQIFDTSVFVSLKDLGATLPSYGEEAIALTMSPEQSGQYHAMENTLRAEARQHPRWLSTWLQWSLSRPNSGFRDEKVIKLERDEDGNVTARQQFMDLPAIVAGTDAVGINEYGEPIYEANGNDPLPKEAWLASYVKAEKSAGRKVLVFARQTGTRDIQPRLKAVLEAAGLRALVLSSSVSTRQREAWINDRSGRVDALICNPKLVETGLDLVQFSTVVFYEMDYDLFTLWQAMRRVWRLGQTQQVKVLFTAYQGTLEEQALRLMGLKMKAAQLLYGDEVGGAIVPETNENFLTELARSILQEQELPDLKALFAASQAQVMTNSPLGSAATPSPRLGLSQSQIAALYEQLLAEKQAKAKAKASRKEQQGQLRLPNGTTAVVQQMSMF